MLRRTCAPLAKAIPPFHLAVPVHSVPLARQFYGTLLGGVEGRRDGDLWQDYNWAGHQLVCHWAGHGYRARDYFNPVDRHKVPVPHFGLCLSVAAFKRLARRLDAAEKRHVRHAAAANKGGKGNKAAAKGQKKPKRLFKYVIRPCLRFPGMPGAQHTLFIRDPSGNAVECKAMVTPRNLFAKYDVAKAKPKAN